MSTVPLIPDSAPFTVEQRAWLNGFLAGWLGTVTSAEVPDEAKHAETEVRSLTGAGAV